MSILIAICQILGAVLILGGAFFFIAATVGVIRMPDPYNRGHTAGKGDSVGLLFSLLGVWLYWVTVNPVESIKILIIIAFMFFANPIAIHAILRVCFRTNVPMYKGTTMHKAEKQKSREW